ncbi:MAG: DUF4331 family protein [Candidatus Binatia bacterium]|nr:DUF4331 family protein [Candidatus Binatia bacterium]
MTGIESDPGDALGVASFYLPDVLALDLAEPATYPNGRRLEEDVVGFAPRFLGGTSPPSTDCVDANYKPFGQTFPYLAIATTGLTRRSPEHRSCVTRATRTARAYWWTSSRTRTAIPRRVASTWTSTTTTTDPSTTRTAPRPIGGLLSKGRAPS